MKYSTKFKSGDWVTLIDPDGNREKFRVNIGDAMLNGQEDQIWLCNDQTHQKQYVRKMPENNMAIGVALFASWEELTEILHSKRFYFG